MCEKCVAKINGEMDSDNIAVSNMDVARVRELLETVQGIAKRNNWPFFAHYCSRGTDGPSLNSLISVNEGGVALFAMMVAVARRPEAGILLDSLYTEFIETIEALAKANALESDN